MPEYKKHEAKEWARATYRGLENIILPSLKEERLEDGATLNLDQAGIRHDVETSKRHKFFMTTAAIEGVPFLMLEYLMRDFWEIVVDQARGEILVDAYVSANTLDDAMATARLAQECGCDSLMLAYPPYFYPRGEDEIYEFTKAVCDSVDLAVTAYATHKPNYERFHTSTFNPHLLARIAGIQNVVAMKLGVIDTAHNTHCFKLFGEKILVAAPFPDLWPTYVPLFGQQWAGSVPYEVFQDTDKPYLVDLFNLLVGGRFEDAMQIYWKIWPAIRAVREYTDYTVYEGNYNIMHWKYFGWLAGMNGGPITLPTGRLYEHQKERIKAARRAIGLSVPADDEEFYVGRVNYRKNREGK